MPQAPRRPPQFPRASPPPPPPLRRSGTAERLSFAPARSASSVARDGRGYQTVDGTAIEVPFVYWPQFKQLLNRLWVPGPPDWPNSNFAIVAKARSGKSTFTREIIELRDRSVIFGTKMVDEPLYRPLLQRGWVMRETWTPENTEESRVIFRPPLAEPTLEAIAKQKEAFRVALIRLWQLGGWTVWFDEIRYLSEQLNLKSELNLLWLQGGSGGTVILALTQRPVSVPLNMFEQSRFLVTFRITGREDRRTMSDYAGNLAPVVFEVAAELEPRELLFCDTELDIICRTRVELPRGGRDNGRDRTAQAPPTARSLG